MAGCCNPTDYRRLFSRKFASRDARRYRKRGLTGTSRTLVELAGDVRGATVLDVGGGIGAIELELLAAGAARATNVELSGGYEEEATELIATRGLSDRVERRGAALGPPRGGGGAHPNHVLPPGGFCFPAGGAALGRAAGAHPQAPPVRHPPATRAL